MKKFLNALFNVFWVLLVGLVAAISNALLGALCCVTIVGIPLGLQYFKFIKLVFAPAGKVVVTKYSRHPVMNTFWIVFGGFLAVTIYFLLALLLCVTVVGIPLARQLFKIMKFMCAPFGSEILKDGEYSKDKNLTYDMKLLNRHICAAPEAATEHVRSKNEEIEKLRRKKTTVAYIFGRWIQPIAIVGWCVGNIVDIVLQALFDKDFQEILIATLWAKIIIGIFAVILIVKIIKRLFYGKMEWSFCKKHISALIAQYPEGSPIAAEKYERLEKMLNPIGLTCATDSGRLLYHAICAEPNVMITLTDGSVMTVGAYLCAKREDFTKYMKMRYQKKRTRRLLFILSCFGLLYVLIPAVIYAFIFSSTKRKDENKLYEEHFKPLEQYYPIGTPIANKKDGTVEAVFERVGLSWSKEELKEEDTQSQASEKESKK